MNVIKQIDSRINEFEPSDKNRLMKIRGKLLYKVRLNKAETEFLKANDFIFKTY